MKMSVEDLSRLLTNRNIRSSPQRMKVLEFLIENQSHPTVEQIFHDLHKEIPSLSKSTVYNTLNSFIEAGLVRMLNIEENEARYDIVMENHGHFKCNLCNEITNFPIQIEAFTSDLLKDYVIQDKNVYFKGICVHCRR